MENLEYVREAVGAFDDSSMTKKSEKIRHGATGPWLPQRSFAER
jgi:hypothetical protein